MTDPNPAQTQPRITPAQRQAARWTGAILLAAMATSMFAELYLLRGVPYADPAAMAAHILANEAAYRAGTLIHVLTFATDAAIAAALYVVLAPVSRGLALLGAFWRLVDAAILTLAKVLPLAMLRLIGEADYLTAAFTEAQRQGLARWLYGVQADGMKIGWILLGLGSAAFALAWWKSRYIPRPLAAWGLGASLLMALGAAANLHTPGAVPMWGYMAPMFFYEVPLGVWLLARGLREPR